MARSNWSVRRTAAISGERYTVSTKPETKGDLLKVEQSGAWRAWRGKKCWELRGQTDVCPGCPAFSLEPGEQRTGVLQEPRGSYTVISAEAARNGSSKVESISISDQVLVDLIHEKLRRIVASARLSEKERSVVELLFLGRQTREIGAALGISGRTVKFHVTNLLEKIDADSRLDITRKLLLTEDMASANSKNKRS
jgi:DNA-binding CsgD family transcriptional regulator